MYLQLVNDPILGQGGIPGKDVVNLSMAFSTAQIADFKARFKALPRQVFDATMVQAMTGYDSQGDYGLASQELKNVLANDEKKTIYALMLDLFNEVNQAEMISRGISDPWEWEAQKMQVLYETQANASLAASNPDLFLQTGQGSDYTKIITRQAFEKRAVKIGERIPDQAYSLQFMLGIKLLLDREEWEIVRLVLETYEGMSAEQWDVLQTFFHK